MSEKIVLLLCNAPTACAADLARAVVGERLAACVNLLPEVQSVYHWQGQLEEAWETPLLCKTTASAAPALMARLAQLHPYDVPEILSWPIADGLPSYLSWVAGEVISSPCERKTV